MGKIIDLTGMKFGEWEVLSYAGDSYWKCQCSCGSIKKVHRKYLLDGESKSCGHVKDLTGKQFGDWLVLNSISKHKYRCRCICGIEEDISRYYLAKETSKSCRHINNFIDLSGKQFGMWTVINYAGNHKWNCKCTCGVTREVRGHDLRNGASQSCGHIKHELKPIMNLTGKTFGEWTVLDYVGNSNWKCKCSCGTERNIGSYALRNGKTASCGHNDTEFKNLIGQQFSDWTVIKYEENGKWLCKCSCGKEVEVLNNSLLTGKSKSCGHNTNSFKDLTAMTFGEITANRYIGNGMWECICSCGNTVSVHTYALRSGNTKSCGHAKSRLSLKSKLEKYGESSMSRLSNPREEWQIITIASKENLEEYLKKFSFKPTYTELSKMLDIGYAALSQRVRKYGLESYVNIADTSSEKEKELCKFIKSITDSTVEANVKNIIQPYELDIYIPDKKIAIEFNGTYWHNSDIKQKNYHQIKTIKCAKLGIRLIHIFEYEWDNLILRDKLCLFLKNNIAGTEKIYARNTDLVEIQRDKAKEFINEYHLQGYAFSDIHYALQVDNEIIAVMTFGKPRFDNKYEFELIRLCFKNGISVIGGAEKLFKHFINKNKPKNIITYSDISKFTGNIYTKLGFKTTITQITDPSYVWVHATTNEVLTRYKTMKFRLIKDGVGMENQTENEIMKDLGYYKIYNCGNLKLTYES